MHYFTPNHGDHLVEWVVGKIFTRGAFCLCACVRGAVTWPKEFSLHSDMSLCPSSWWMGSRPGFLEWTHTHTPRSCLSPLGNVHNQLLLDKTSPTYWRCLLVQTPAVTSKTLSQWWWSSSCPGPVAVSLLCQPPSITVQLFGFTCSQLGQDKRACQSVSHWVMTPGLNDLQRSPTKLLAE